MRFPPRGGRAVRSLTPAQRRALRRIDAMQPTEWDMMHFGVPPVVARRLYGRKLIDRHPETRRLCLTDLGRAALAEGGKRA